MKPTGTLGLLISVLLVSGCFQEEAPRPAAPVTTPALASEAAIAPAAESHSGTNLAAVVREHADPEVRREAIYAIADAEGEAEGIESSALIGEALYDPEPRVRLSAVEALTGLRSDSSADWLSIALGDPDPRVRRAAVEALGEIGGPNAKFLLQQALGDVDASVRETAQEMLDEPEHSESGAS